MTKRFQKPSAIFLSRKNGGGVLRLEEMVPDKVGEETVLRSVHEILKDKHPPMHPVTQ